MTVALTCPDQQRLEQLLLGLLTEPETAELEEHVEGCAACLDRMRLLRTDDGFLADVRSSARPLDWNADVNTALLHKVCRLGGTVAGLPQGEQATVLDAEDLLRDEAIAGYRIERLLGHGGMGVVYLAWHERLKRPVALKMIRLATHALPERLERFRREAQLIARLRHPNVVQVHEAGDHQGRPFLVMEYVEGGTLAQLLLAGPLPYAVVAQTVESIARGAHAAHEAGVVHRDLKPANVLLQEGLSQRRKGAKEDQEEGELKGTSPSTLPLSSCSSFAPLRLCESPSFIPKITDFGLAKAFAESESWDTQSGAVLGTPAYMAPEQVAGSRDIGPASDVYALGAILYECLTGRPPFKAASPLETLEQVRSQEPVSPRRLQPGVPRDLDTICLHCLHKEPRQRYPSALALADDLRRFLDGRPVQARPLSLVGRLWKWARRRPALAGLVLVSGLALVAGAVGAVVYEGRLRSALGVAEVQRERADGNYRQAREALTKMLASANSRQRADLPRLQELRREQQQAALAFYLAIAEQPESRSVEVRFDVAQARLEAGKLQTSLGALPDSRVNLDRALEAFTALAQEFPAESRYRAMQVACLKELGHWHGFNEQAGQCYERACRLLEELTQQHPASFEYRESLAAGLHSRGSVAHEAKRYAEAERLSLQAVALYRNLVKDYPEDVLIQESLARTYVNLSLTCQLQKGRRKESQEYHDLAAATFEPVVAKEPQNYGAITSLAALRINWAYMLAAEGNHDKAIEGLAKNVTLLEKALRQEPNLATLRGFLLRTHGTRAQILEGRKRYREEVSDRQRVVELAEPGAEQIFNRLFLAQAYARSGDHASAVAEVDVVAASSLHPAGKFQQSYHLATVCGVAVSAVRADRGLSETEKKMHAERYAARAVELLGQARTAAGPVEWKKFRLNLVLEPPFLPLLLRTDFLQLFKD